MKALNDPPAKAPKMQPTENDLPLQRRSEMNVLMNQRLADAVDLQMQMKQAHWNVKGPGLGGLPELFDQVARSVETYVDMIARRIVQSGGIARGTVRVSAALSVLDEYPLVIVDGSAHVDAIANALFTFGHDARNTIQEATKLNDLDSANLFTEISRGIDQWLQFIEAHPQTTK